MSNSYNFKKKNTWLITGCCGFIGTNLTLCLLNNNQRVIGIDNFLTGNRRNLNIFKNNINYKLLDFYEGDLCDIQFVKKILSKKIDYVLHQAALGSVPRSLKNPINTNRNNVDATLNLFFFSAKNKNIKKVVFASSGSVYGDVKGDQKKENKIGIQLSPYGASKRITEIYADTFSKCYSLKYVSLRYFNVFGPYQRNNGPYPTVISGWIKSAIKKQTLKVFGDGKQTRDFCYVEDVVYANIASAINKNITNKTINISGGKSISLNDLTKVFKKIYKKNKLKVIYLKKRDGDILNSKANLSNAKRFLKYKPKNEFEKNLEDTINWYLR
jgi:UDP-N-acetylglucosamine 4-epimerase